jgi:imidazolonepropionase-like amidohydrolase
LHAWGHDPDHTHLAYSPEEIRALVEEGHRNGVKVSAHAIGTESVRSAILAGVDTIEHGHGIDDDTRKLMVDHGAILVPTLALQHLRATRGPTRGMPEEEIRAANAHRTVQRESFEKALKAGLKIALGTDIVGPPYADHGLNGLEFQLMTEYGASPMNALVAGTRAGAEALGMERDIGTVEPGKLADLVATKEDPLNDITALQRVAFVMQSGQVIKCPTSAIQTSKLGKSS